MGVIMSDDYRYNLRLPSDLADYVKDAAWRNKTTIQGYIERLVREDASKNAVKSNG